jgi:putative lipoprotein
MRTGGLKTCLLLPVYRQSIHHKTLLERVKCPFAAIRAQGLPWIRAAARRSLHDCILWLANGLGTVLPSIGSPAMRVVRSSLLSALLPLFAACQMLSAAPPNPSAGLTRMQGELSGQDGQLLFQPCNDTRRYVVTDTAGTSLLQEATTLASQPGKLFVDLRGRFDAGAKGGGSGQVKLQQVYRLTHSSRACNDPDFKRLKLFASGQAPHWTVQVTPKGMEINRPGQPPLALPYLEETLPDGRLSLSSEANGQRAELWVAPQRCVDPATGTVSSLTAEFRFNNDVQRGCAWFGGARDN